MVSDEAFDFAKSASESKKDWAKDNMHERHIAERSAQLFVVKRPIYRTSVDVGSAPALPLALRGYLVAGLIYADDQEKDEDIPDSEQPVLQSGSVDIAEAFEASDNGLRDFSLSYALLTAG